MDVYRPYIAGIPRPLSGIDDKLEIILTSGFDYLVKTEKEFTYIVRPVSTQRF